MLFIAPLRTLRLKPRHAAHHTYEYCQRSSKQEFDNFEHFWAPILTFLDPESGCKIDTDPNPDPNTA